MGLLVCSEAMMGEAKRRKLASARGAGVVYHHTSTLRTNLLWMSGVIELEGRSPPVIHPQLGEIRTDALARRAMNDFPPVAWFTTETAVPKCLRQSNLRFVDKATGRVRHEDLANRQTSDALALNRVAIGFRLPENPTITPWKDHPGYVTPEGQELNESAIEAGDDPTSWYVSEVPVDLLKSIEFWSSRKVLNPKLERFDNYLKDLHNMVRMCRSRRGVYIPPTWLTAEQARALSAQIGVPAFSGDTELADLPAPRTGSGG
jgi:hypothetical protein